MLINLEDASKNITIPSVVYSLNLSLGAISLYGYYLMIADENGEVIKTNFEISNVLRITSRTILSYRRELEKEIHKDGKSLIQVEKQVNGRTHTVKVIDINEENESFFSALNKKGPQEREP